MKNLVLIVAAMALTGCAAFNNMDNGHEADCSAKLKSYTFGMGDYYKVHIDRVKTDHVGQEWVRPTSNLDLHISGWQHKETFYDYQCNK